MIRRLYREKLELLRFWLLRKVLPPRFNPPIVCRVGETVYLTLHFGATVELTPTEAWDLGGRLSRKALIRTPDDATKLGAYAAASNPSPN